MLSDDEHEMGGDEGEDLGRDVEVHKEEIESEEHYGDGTMEDVDLDDAVEDLTDTADDEDVEVDVDVEDEEEDMDMDDDDMDMDAEMDADADMDMDADMEGEEHEEEGADERFRDIEQAIDELTAEFEAMKAELHGEHGDTEEDKEPLKEMADSGTTPAGTHYKFSSDGTTLVVNGRRHKVQSASGYGSVEILVGDLNIGGTPADCEVWEEDDEENILFSGDQEKCWHFVIDHLAGLRENWMDDTDDLDEEYDDLDEAVELDTVHVDLKKAAEVGAGKFARPDVSKTSPTPKASPSPVPGAKAVETGKGPKADGYHLQPAPSSASMNITNRRKKATDDMGHVSKEGSTKAMLNKDRTEGFGAANVRSPLGSTGTTPKK